MKKPRRIFVSLYAASGAAALIYEVAWTRLLTLQLGHTVAAASTVLAAFMGGLALGAWVASLVPLTASDKPRSAGSLLRAYAVLEIVVAAAALLLPAALSASVPALAWAYADGGTPARFALVRVAISLGLLGLPAAAMGATFPIAASWFSRAAADTGFLYAANTAGAAIGAIAAGFFLIPAIGLRATTAVGVTLNLLAAGGAWWLSSTTINAEPAELAETGRAKKDTKALRVQRVLRLPSSSQPVLACAAAAVSGFAALVYEVAWTRLLALVIGPTTYAFATMAAAFISGLAIGSALGSRIARRAERPAVWMAAMLVTSSIAAAGGAWLAATQMPLIVAAQVADPDVNFMSVVVTQALGTAVLLMPMTFALGAMFPLALATAQSVAPNAGRDAARVYTANTIGAIAGALTAGFGLIPALGLRTTFAIAAVLGVLGGAACLAVALGARRTSNIEPRTAGAGARTFDVRRSPFVVPVAVVVLSVAAILSLPSWD